MDLFAITCTTCKTRLRVREESAIGQILACPKCGGMVMVKAPEGWTPGLPLPPPRIEPPAGATAVVEVKRKDETSSDTDFDDIDHILANAPPKPKHSVVTVAPDAPGLARPRFARSTGPAPPGGSSIGKNGPAAAAAASVAATAAAPGEPPTIKTPAEGQPDKADPADSESVPDFRPRPAQTSSTYLQYVGLPLAVVAGIGLAIAVVAASASFFRNEPEKVVQSTTPPPPESPGRQPATNQSTEPATTPAATPPAPVTPAVGTPADTKSPPASAPATAAPQPSPSDANPTPPPKPRSPFDDILEPEKDPLAAPEAPATPLPATPPAAVPPEPAPDEPPPKPLVPRPEPRVVDVAARLADPLAALETEGTPLAEFLDVMSELSTIPITLEPDALPLAQASAASPVVLKLPGTTIGGALAAGLKPLGLEYVPVEDQLIVRLIEPADLQVLAYPHKDLTGGDEAAAADLAELIQAVVDPPSWKQGEAGPAIEVSSTLRIKQRRSSHAQIFLLCEKLRTARKLPYASRFPPALFQLDSRTKQATPRLKAPVSINFHQTTPLVKILRELERSANAAAPANRGPGLRIIVDWQDIAAGGWNPDAATTLVVENESLALALQKLLEPMDLAWRVVDVNTIQVLTPAALEGRCEMELFFAGDLTKSDPAGQELIAGIRETLGEAIFRDQGGPCELRYDVSSGCLVSLLPQPKQQDLEVYLLTLRKPQ